MPTSKEHLAKMRAAKAAKAAAAKQSEAAPPPVPEARPAPRPGQTVRVLLPRSRDPMQRLVVALVSEVDSIDQVLVWTIPGRMNSGFTITVQHRSKVARHEDGWWEEIA